MIQGFNPVVDEQSKILILGSMPSVASLTQKQYYGHPQNRFWKIFESIYDIKFASYDEKLSFLHKQHIGLWDVIAQCKREGSLDSNISEAVDNDIVSLLQHYPNITKVICNGNTAGLIYRRKFSKKVSLPYVVLPSTSPANASYSLSKLVEIWIPALQTVIYHKE